MFENELVLAEAKASNWSLLSFLFQKPMLIIFLGSMIFLFVGIFNPNYVWFVIFGVFAFIYLLAIFLKHRIISRRYYVLTNIRVIEKQKNNRDTKFVPLKQISSVSTIRAGIFKRIFDYGDIIISTTGNNSFREVTDIADPNSFSEEISKAILL